MGTKDRSRAILGPVVGWMQRHRAPVGFSALLIFAVIVAFAWSPIRALTFNTNPRSMEPRDSPASIALHAIKAAIPDLQEPLMVVVDANDAEDSSRRWAKLQQRMQEMQDQQLLSSYASPLGFQFSPVRIAANQPILATVNWEEARKSFRETVEAEGFNPDAFQSAEKLFDALKAAPATPVAKLTNLRQALPESSSWWFLIDRFLAPNGTLSIGYLRLPQPLKSADEIERFEKPLLAADPQARVTGWGYSLLTLVPWARSEALLFSVGVSSLILIMLAFAYRNWRPWLTHALSLVFAVSLTVTVLKLTGVQINLLNALAFPLILGVGVDYGMHILMAAHDTDELATVLKPVVISGLTTIVGFGALMAANNPALSGLGLVCAVGVASCLVSALLFAVPVLGLFPQSHSPAKTL